MLKIIGVVMYLAIPSQGGLVAHATYDTVDECEAAKAEMLDQGHEMPFILCVPFIAGN